MVKCRKGLHSLTKNPATTSHSTSCWTSVEAVDDDEDHVRHNASHPKKPNSILEGTDDEEDNQSAVKRRKGLHSLTKNPTTTSHSTLEGTDDEVEASTMDNVKEQILQEEMDEQELSKSAIHTILTQVHVYPACLQKDWRSPIYVFFRPEVKISYVDGRCVHDFTCAAKQCKGKGKNSRLVRRYLDTGDKKSTSGSLPTCYNLLER